MAYLKLFKNHFAYEVERERSSNLANVSHCVEDAEIHYNTDDEETKVVAKYMVIEPNFRVILTKSSSRNISEMEIDGVVQPNVVTAYTFNTAGEHTVKYTLNRPSALPNSMFEGCFSIRSVFLPNSITTIGNNVFNGCPNLNSIVLPLALTNIGNYAFKGCWALRKIAIPSSVNSIGNGAFESCSNLRNIMSLPMTAPTIQSDTFKDISSSAILKATLYVRRGSSGYDAWMSNDDYYLGKYGWRKVVQ